MRGAAAQRRELQRTGRWEDALIDPSKFRTYDGMTVDWDTRRRTHERDSINSKVAAFKAGE